MENKIMENQIKYTFLLPAYKPNFLEEALRSIKEQTYTDFKVIVSDDCSLHDLKSIFEKTCGDDPRFVFRRNEKNMGGKSLVSHWNLLVDMCDTEYFVMASDDDVYEPNFLVEADKLLVKYPKANLLRARSRVIDGEENIKAEENVTDEWLDNLHFIHRIYQKDWVGGIASFVYRTKHLKDKGNFVDFPSAWFSDDVTNFLMADEGCCMTQEVAFKVRSSDYNISSKWGDPEDSREKMIATYMNYRWMKEYMRSFDNYADRKFLVDVTKEYKYKIYTNIQNYIYSCRPFSFFKFLLQCPSDIGLCKIRMFAHWLRGRFKYTN